MIAHIVNELELSDTSIFHIVIRTESISFDYSNNNKTI